MEYTASARMNALVLTKDSVIPSAPRLSLMNVIRPQITDEDDLIIQVKAAGIQPSDIVNYRGHFPYTTFPRVIGRDFSGVVVEGSKDDVGLEVFGSSGKELSFTHDGTHAEYVKVKRQAVAVKPAWISHQQAAIMGVPFVTAMLMLERSEVKAGQVVVVIGCRGSVGSAIMKLAKAQGIQSIGVARASGGDISLEKDPGMREVAALRGGKGPNAILETTGSLSLMEKAINCLDLHGMFAWIAAPRNSQSTRLNIDMMEIYRKEIKLVGCNSLVYHSIEAGAYLDIVTQLMKSGKVQAPNIDSWKIINLPQALEAFQRLAQGDSFKYIVVP